MVSKANLTGVGRRDDRTFLIPGGSSSTPTPGAIGGADTGPSTSGAPTIGRYVSTGWGSSQHLTDTEAAIEPAGAAPKLTLAVAGTYLITGSVQLDAVGATTTTQQANIRLQRTNNTPLDLEADVVVDLGAMMLVTRTIGMFVMPSIIYVTPRNDDEISIYGALTAVTATGNIDAVNATLVALRIT